MKHLTLQELGKIIRKVRKDRGLRLEDLADDNISPATVSNIERGIAHVSPEKISYLLQKLNLSEHQLSEIVLQEEKDLHQLKLSFLMISTLCELGYADEALAMLQGIQLKENHPFTAKVYYYKGCCLYEKKKWKQAERTFLQSLHYAKQNQTDPDESNLEAACYLHLGLCQYHQNNYEQALAYLDHGLKAYNENSSHHHIQQQLYLNKIECLKKLHRITEGNQLLQEIWGSIQHTATDIQTTIHFYILRSEFAQKAGLFDEAINYATDGIKIASRNKQLNQLLNLWTILGNLYMMSGQWSLSESCFQMVIHKKNKIASNNKPLSAYLQLGILYMKQKQYQKAYQLLQTALHYSDPSRYSKEFSLSLLIMGDLCMKLGKHDEALYYFQKGQKITEKNEDQTRELSFWLRLAQYWEGKDNHKFQNCIENIYRLKKQQIISIHRHDPLNESNPFL